METPLKMKALLALALLSALPWKPALSETLLMDSPGSKERPWILDDNWRYGGLTQKLSTSRDEDGTWLSAVDYAYDESIPGSEKGELKLIRSVALKDVKGARFLLKVSDPGLAVSIRISDASGQWLSGNLKIDRADEWIPVKAPFSSEFLKSHWTGAPGAAEDGKIRFPVCHLVVAARKGAKSGQSRGSLLLKGFSLDVEEAGDGLPLGLKASSDAPDGVAFVGEKSLFRIEASSRTDSPRDGLLRFHCESDDRKALDKTAPFSFKKAGDMASLEIPVDSSEPRFFSGKAWIEKDGKRVVETESALAVVARPRDFGRFAPDAFFGIVSGQGRAEEGCERIGSKNERVWAWLNKWSERPFSPLAFQRTEQALEEARAHFMNVIMTLNVSRRSMPEKAGWKEMDQAAASREILDYWSGVAGLAAERYRGRILALELVNEPDNEIWHGPGYSLDKAAGIYAALLEAGRKAVKEKAPEILVSGLDVSGRDFSAPDSGPSDQIPGDFKFSKAVLAKAPGVIDLCGGHPYSHNRFLGPGRRVQLPEDMDIRGKFSKLGDLLEANGCPKRIWSTEMGWAMLAKPEALDETSRLFAAIVAQAMTLAKSSPGVEKALWFISHWHSFEEPHYYDLFYCGYPLSRKIPFCVSCSEKAYPALAASAYAACAGMLEGTRFVKRLDAGDCVSAWLFERKDAGEGVVAFWSRTDGARLFKASFPFECEAIDGVGRTKSQGKEASVPFDRQPVYLRIKSNDFAAIEQAIRGAEFKSLEPLSVRKAFLSSPRALRVLLEKRDDAPLDALFEVAGAKETMNFKGAGMKRIEIPLPNLVKPGSSLLLKAGVEGALKSVAISISTELIRAGYLEKPVVDGSLSSVASLQASCCDGRAFLFPPDATWKGPTDLSISAYFGWNEQGLYFAAEVKDDVHCAPFDSARDFWKSDSVQIAIDSEGWALQEYDADVREIGLVLGKSGPKAFLWTKAGGVKEFNPKLAIVRGEGSTRYEAFFSWESLALQAPEPGRVMPMNFLVNENDGQGRASWLSLTPGIGDSKAPASYKSFVLEKN